MTAVVLTPVVEIGPADFVPVEQLTDQTLRALVHETLDGADLATDPDEIPMLAGGYALSRAGGPTLTPGCCSDLGDLDSWVSAVNCPEGGWTLLWTGHPSTAVRRRNGWLELSEPTDGPVPTDATLPVITRVRPGELEQAVAAAGAARDRFADRLTAVLRREFDRERQSGRERESDRGRELSAEAAIEHDLGPIVHALLGRP